MLSITLGPGGTHTNMFMNGVVSCRTAASRALKQFVGLCARRIVCHVEAMIDVGFVEHAASVLCAWVSSVDVAEATLATLQRAARADS